MLSTRRIWAKGLFPKLQENVQSCPTANSGAPYEHHKCFVSDIQQTHKVEERISSQEFCQLFDSMFPPLLCPESCVKASDLERVYFDASAESLKGNK